MALAALLLPAAAPAALFHPGDPNGERTPAITLRKRLHVNTLITEPGTMEIEWGGAFSQDGTFTLPTAIHFTPEGPHAWWGRTEFSASLDSLSYDRAGHFGDRATLAATCLVRDGDKLDIAIAPQFTYLLRGDNGARAGATAIARYDVGSSSAGLTFTWTGATNPSPTNPAGIFDLGAGYRLRLGPSGPLDHLINAPSELAPRKVHREQPPGFAVRGDGVSGDGAVRHRFRGSAHQLVGQSARHPVRGRAHREYRPPAAPLEARRGAINVRFRSAVNETS
jgi:hypothetical protein